MDKRSKAYKNWLENQEKGEAKKVGLGDIVEKVTEATGIKAAVKFIAGEDCGCDERKEKLNKIPFFSRRKFECFTETEYEYLTEVFNSKLQKIDPSTQKKMSDIYTRVSGLTYTSGCTACSFISKVYRPLEKYYNEYNKMI